jgi:hypothetical protein
MDPAKLGPAEIFETRLHLDYDLSSIWTVSTDYAFNDGDLYLIGTKNLGNNLYGNVTAVADLQDGAGNTLNALDVQQQVIDGERRLLFGITWTN